MKKLVVILTLILAPIAFAQSVDVKDVEAEEGETTTIEIRKGKKADTDAKGNTWEVVDGTADIEGDEAPMSREARKNWKAACKTWEKELRQDNKENKVLAINCGKPTCQNQSGGTICTSQATYKIKTKL
ncbi:MAG: hypothetical protein H6624_10685 [Bdellovibrionaceae bacterium]|nr:hypothetical protein [Bdellovibrionales bacterium]MCB9084802.1 hypothetical protein [Pseudobdellovibrionaceae bacterium]